MVTTIFSIYLIGVALTLLFQFFAYKGYVQEQCLN